MLWSQMHDDEPSATPALLDTADSLLSSRDPAATALLTLREPREDDELAMDAVFIDGREPLPGERC